MALKDYSTITPEQVDSLARTLAQRDVPILDRFDPVADFEELVSFATLNPTPVSHADRNPIWRLESVAARLIEAFAVAAHEPTMLEAGWKSLAEIILEHAEYLYTYHSLLHAREQLQAGAALALVGCVCREIPQSAAWRLVGFSQTVEAIEAVEDLRSHPHLVEPVDAAFEIAVTFDLPILDEAIDRYNATLHRDLRWKKRTWFKLTDQDFFNQLNLDYPGLEAVKSDLERGNLEEAKFAYVDFLREKADLLKLWDDETCDASRITPDMAKSYLEDALYLSAYTVCHQSTARSAQMETSRLAVAALLFPEWRDGEQLIKLALRRYKWIHDRCFFPDGFQTECTSSSHHFFFTYLSNFCRIAKLMQPHLLQDFDTASSTQSKDFTDLFEKVIEVFMYLSQPDYHLPLLGDCTAYIDVREPCRVGHDLFNREDFHYMASEGKAGTLPIETSYAFPYAGYYVMRDHWGADAQYLVFDGGYFGSLCKLRGSEHLHEDKLNFILYAYGRPLIIDPGVCQGDDDFESYFRSTCGHNSLMIDGKGQCRRFMTDEEITPDPNTRWLTTPSFDFVEGWYKEGYAGEDGSSLDLELQHKRSIFYVKGRAQSSHPTNGEYFILHDLVLGEGEHLLEQIFHIAPVPAGSAADVEIMGNGVVRTAAPELSNIVIAPVDGSDLEAQLRCGETDPVAGWTGVSGKIPSYDLTYAKTCSLPAVMNAVLFCLRPEEEVAPAVKPMEVSTDADVLATGFTVTHGQYTDLILISDDGFATLSTPDVEFVGEYLFTRLDARGEPQWIAMVSGQFLKVNGYVLVELSEPQEVYVI